MTPTTEQPKGRCIWGLGLRSRALGTCLAVICWDFFADWGGGGRIRFAASPPALGVSCSTCALPCHGPVRCGIVVLCRTAGLLRQTLLDQWGMVYTMCQRDAKAAGTGVMPPAAGPGATEALAIYGVLSAMMDHSPAAPAAAHQPLVEHAAYQGCAAQCTVVEVVRARRVYRLRFRSPAVAAELQRQETFRDRMKAEVLACAAEAEDAGEAFQRRATRVIHEALTHRRLGDRQVLGLLHQHQGYVQRVPLVLTVLINMWLLLCESLYYRRPGEGVAVEDVPAADYTLLHVLALRLLQGLVACHVASTGLRLLWYIVTQVQWEKGERELVLLFRLGLGWGAVAFYAKSDALWVVTGTGVRGRDWTVVLGV